MRCRLHQDRQGTRRTEVTARPATNPAQPEHSSAPMNLHPRRDTPVPQNQQTPTATSPAAGVFHSRPFMSGSHVPVFPSHSAPLSTTAALPAILCHCGMAFLTVPLLQTFRTALPSCYASTTAAFPAFLCRCGSSPRKVPARSGRCRRKLFFTVIFQNQPELSACP